MPREKKEIDKFVIRNLLLDKIVGGASGEGGAENRNSAIVE